MRFLPTLTLFATAATPALAGAPTIAGAMRVGGGLGFEIEPSEWGWARLGWVSGASRIV